MTFFKTIYEEMLRGNFSFAILIVGAIQVVLMIIGLIERRKK